MSSRRFSVGYALAPKKEQSFIQLSLVNHAKERGIDLVRIDTTRPLVEQGPFDCVIHKLYGHEWKSQLYEFSSQNPSVPIIDAPDAIERLHNRVSMLEVVKQLEVSQELNTFGIPKQIVIYRSEELFPPSKLGGLEFPVIAKPLVADGSAKSHKMSLVFNQEGFHKLKPPLVLQEFVNHGGAIFKVYVVGEYVKCVKRRSLPDVSEEKLLTLEGSLPFSQISNLTAQEHGEKDSGNDDNDSCDFNETNLEDVEMPPPAFLTGIARGLRQALKLNLFNFDVIRDSLVGNRYLVIDINYFPGYAKMPCYESALTDFFWDVVHLKRNGTENMEVKTESQKPFVKEEKKVHVNNSCCGGDDVGIPSTSPPISGEKDNVI